MQKKPSLGILLNAKQETSRILNEQTEEYAARSMIRQREREQRQQREAKQRHPEYKERER